MTKAGLIQKRDISQLPLCCVLNPFVSCFVCEHRECIKHIGKLDKAWRRRSSHDVSGEIVTDEFCCRDCFVRLEW